MPEFKKKFLFTDLDDTLLNKNKEITSENRAAINIALSAGHKIVLSSGRPLCTILPVAEKLELDIPGCYIICFNGSMIYDCGAGKPIFVNPVSQGDASYVFKAAKKAGIHVHTYDDDGLVTPELNKEIDWYEERTGIEIKLDPNLPETLTWDPVKVIFLEIEDHDRLEAFKQQLMPWAEGKVDLFYSGPELLECVSKGMSKGAAVKWLVEYLGGHMENTVAAGDAENDIPMLQAAAIGCAMKNATDACKAAADYITENDCENSGVAEIIRNFIIN